MEKKELQILCISSVLIINFAFQAVSAHSRLKECHCGIECLSSSNLEYMEHICRIGRQNFSLLCHYFPDTLMSCIICGT